MFTHSHVLRKSVIPDAPRLSSRAAYGRENSKGCTKNKSGRLLEWRNEKIFRHAAAKPRVGAEQSLAQAIWQMVTTARTVASASPLGGGRGRGGTVLWSDTGAVADAGRYLVGFAVPRQFAGCTVCHAVHQPLYHRAFIPAGLPDRALGERRSDLGRTAGISKFTCGWLVELAGRVGQTVDDGSAVAGNMYCGCRVCCGAPLLACGGDSEMARQKAAACLILFVLLINQIPIYVFCL